jgi:GNAT superfamily N-acetyltransferase
MAGNITGALYVDRLDQPRAGLIVYHNRMCLAGDAALPGFNASLRRFLQEEYIPPRLDAGWGGFAIFSSPDHWLAALPPICAPYRVIQETYQYYERMDPDPSPVINLPAGFQIHLITPEFLGSGVQGLEDIYDEMCSERTSVEDFLAKSFGFVLVYENQVAGFCMSEYNTDDRCEIGIATFPPHQRRGLATQMAQTCMAYARTQGITKIGWHCWENNSSSGATARKAGLQLLHTERTPIVLLREEKQS